MESKRRKVVRSEGREMIASVYHFLKKEYEFTVLHLEPNCDVSHLRNITQRTAEATGVSERTVARILREEKDLPSTSSKFPSPIKNRKKRSKKEDIDEIKADVLLSTIKEETDLPTSLSELQSSMQNSSNYKEDEGFKFDVVLNTIKEEKDLPSTPSSKCQSKMENQKSKGKKDVDRFTDVVLSKIKQEKDRPSTASSELQSMIDIAPIIKEEKGLPSPLSVKYQSPMKNRRKRNNTEDVDVVQSTIKEEPVEILDVAHFTFYEIN